MNIFFLHEQPEQAARWYCDKHCIKQILELSQILCSAYHIQGMNAPYKLTHKNHPSTVWSRTSCLNYEWTIKHGMTLCDEYTARYGRKHASQNVIEWCDKNSHNLKFDNFDQTEFAVAINSDMLCRQVVGFDQMSVVDKYRFYYKLDKVHLHDWKRNKPFWI
jgi:hypothetical protein